MSEGKEKDKENEIADKKEPKKLSRKIFWAIVIVAAVSVIVKVGTLIYSISKG
jgi:hypothetical protein